VGFEIILLRAKMETKLTLNLNKVIIKKAKEYAKFKKTSLSQIVEDYFYYLTIKEKPNRQETLKTPITDELTGALGKIEAEEEKEITNYLIRKYINA